MYLVVETEGFERIFAALDKLENPDWQDLMTRIGGTLEAQTIRHFVEETGPEGKWAANEPSTIARKGHTAILVGGDVKSGYTGTLKGSFTHDVRGPYEVAVGTNIVYGKYHQGGGIKASYPKRMFLGLTEQDSDEIELVIQNYIDEYMAG